MDAMAQMAEDLANLELQAKQRRESDEMKLPAQGGGMPQPQGGGMPQPPQQGGMPQQGMGMPQQGMMPPQNGQPPPQAPSMYGNRTPQAMSGGAPQAGLPFQSPEAALTLGKAKNVNQGNTFTAGMTKDILEKRALGQEQKFQEQQSAAKQEQQARVARVYATQTYKSARAAGFTHEQAQSVSDNVFERPELFSDTHSEIMDEMQTNKGNEFALQEERRNEADLRQGLIDAGVEPKAAQAFANNSVDMIDTLRFLNEREATDVADRQLAFDAMTAQVNTLSDVNNQIRQIKKTFNLVGETSTGLIGSILENVPETDAYKLAQLIDTQRAATAFKALYDMRQASKTGGALGNVSNREIELLYKSFAALEPKAGETITRQALADVLMNFERVKFMLENEKEYNAKFEAGETNAAQMYKDSTEQVNRQMAQNRGEVTYGGRTYDTQKAYDILRADPSAKAQKEFVKVFGYEPLNMSIR